MPLVATGVRPTSAYRMDRARELGLLVKRWRTEMGLGRNEAIDELSKLGVDISYGYLNKLESGDRSLANAAVEIREGLRQLLRISREEWEEATGLYVPHEDGARRQVGISDVMPGGLVLVQVMGGAIGGRPAEYAVPVRRDLVRPSTRAYEVQGDSMDTGAEEGIREGDWVLVDTALKEPVNGKVYLLEIIGDGMTVKRLRAVGGEWLFLSDNPAGESWREDQVDVLGQVYAKINYGEVR